MAQKYHGKNGQIEMGSGSPLTLICSFAEWTADFPRDFTEASTFCDTDAVQFPGAQKPAGTFTGFMTKEDAAAIQAAADADTPTTLRITPSTLEPGVYFEGPAWIAPSYGGTYAGMVTESVTWTGAGPWTKVFGFTSP